MKTVRAGLVVLALFAALAPAAAAQQYQRGSGLATWDVNGRNFSRYSQVIHPNVVANATFYNMQWSLYYGPTGYLGIQTFEGGAAVAHFSMFGATKEFQQPVGSSCRLHTEYEGGAQCQRPISNPRGKDVRLTLAKDTEANGNRWWRAWVQIDGVTSEIGGIRSPLEGKINRMFNFQEYFGPGLGYVALRDGCFGPGPPTSSAVYGRPFISDSTFGSSTLSWTGGQLNTCPGTAAFSNAFFGTSAAIKLGDT